MRTILFLVLLVFFVLCFSLFTGCANQGRYVQGPDGNTHYQLPASRDHEDHCRTASRFAKRVAQSRSHPEFMDGKEFIVPHPPASSRVDFEEDLKDVERFTEVGKRNYDKIHELLDRIIDGSEFKDVPPETVQLTIYSECIEKMANKTWFPNQATSNAQ